ncbi:unnamed protein product [Staurois parvus]|uniref:Uncharacterized protein n=1 Tax=Staurois parvus TaxID=386267 RepID=A0ABN9E6D9_9NEOB|nr:unnamed protein product [Staurois parvus]
MARRLREREMKRSWMASLTTSCPAFVYKRPDGGSAGVGDHL